MRKWTAKLLVCLFLCTALLPACITPAHAANLDYIDRYDVAVQPLTEDGAIQITVSFRWTVLDQGPVEWLQIGIPNGSVRDETALSDNIDYLSYDNSYMYVYFKDGYNDGETFEFSYSWIQEYMYSLGEDGTVSYSYTPGWFDSAEIGAMTLSWQDPAGCTGVYYPDFGAQSDGKSVFDEGSCVMQAANLPNGAQLKLDVSYAQWPVALSGDMTAENTPDEYAGGDYSGDYDGYDDGYYDDGYYEEDSGGGFFSVVMFIIIVFIVLSIISRSADGYNGGFGNTYIFYHGLWYPRGPGGVPRPGSVGLKERPKPPAGGGSRGGGFGGGSRGGGFGGGGFGGGGGHCACASSCACACACACAGGGRAGCSAKNLYGAVKLGNSLTEKLTSREQ